MKRLRGEERWAKLVIETALGVAVQQHDDNSAPGMYDLDIVYPDERLGAVEVTAAADPDAIELWNLLNGTNERWQDPTIRGGWLVSVLPKAPAKRIKAELPRLLARLERENRVSLKVGQRSATDLGAAARGLGISSARQSTTEYPGSIYVTLDLPAERTGGFVPRSGDPLAEWVGDFLAQSKRARVRAKLSNARLAQRHAFIFVPGFTTAPFPVIDLLIRDDAPLPMHDPELPHEVTHVWAMSTWSSGVAFFWSPEERWRRFKKAESLGSGPQ